MLVTQFKLKYFVQSFLIVLLVSMISIPVNAGYSFADTPTKTEQATQKRIKKKNRKLSKKPIKLKSKFSKKERRDDHFGRLALISLGLALFSTFLTIISFSFLAGFFIGLIAALVFSVIGSNRDKNPTKARVILFVYVLAAVILLSMMVIAAIG